MKQIDEDIRDYFKAKQLRTELEYLEEQDSFSEIEYLFTNGWYTDNSAPSKWSRRIPNGAGGETIIDGLSRDAAADLQLEMDQKAFEENEKRNGK